LVLPAVLAIAAAACLAAALHRPSTAAATPGPAPTPAAGAPLVSASRLPVAVSQLAADVNLAAAVDAALTSPPVAARPACVEVDDAGVPVYRRDATAPLIPASNLKLLTATAALDRLGPASTFTTAAVAAAPARGGVVAGPLYLVGGGDPLLATDGYRATLHQWTESREPITRLAALADALAGAGVTRITGGILADDSRYDGVRTVAGWAPSYLVDGEVAPVGALVVDGGTVVAGGRRVPARDPALSAASAFEGLLAERGIAVDGRVTRGTAPAGAVRLASVQSPPLATVVGEMLRESDNLAAEMLVKELGYRFGGGGSWTAGTAVVHATLAAAGIPLDGVVQLDGSGLDRQDRVACQTLAALVATGALEPFFPVAARCGTLVGRMVGQPAAQRIVAKTGSLAGVSALSGAVGPAALPPQSCPPAGASAERVTFSIVFNGLPSTSAGEAVEDRIADTLAAYAQGA
jgi:D-alanyl-D-alanine carboxypeptidase/D-alanyl-D-alanine-endopeptidase (penicillin-binding protein 4)